MTREFDMANFTPYTMYKLLSHTCVLYVGAKE